MSDLSLAIAIVTAFEDAMLRRASGDETAISELRDIVVSFVPLPSDSAPAIAGLATLALALTNELSHSTGEEVSAILQRIGLSAVAEPPDTEDN